MVIGDINYDGVIDVFDVVSLRRILLGGSAEGIVDDVMDLNGDSVVNTADLVKLQHYILGYPDSDLKKISVTLPFQPLNADF